MVPVDQKLIDEFAELTGDRQWIDVDPQRCAVGPFGAPVAHGYLLLALMPRLLAEVLQVGGTALTVNRGLTDVRFQNPVLAGDRIQLAVGSLQVRSRPRDHWQADFSTTATIAGTDKTAFSARVSYLYQQI